MVWCARNDCRRRVPRLVAVYCRTGIFIDDDWYCSAECVEEAVRELIMDPPPGEPAPQQGWRPPKLGTLLMQQVGLSQLAIDSALARCNDATPIGKALREAGLVSADDVLRALATQAGVRYLAAVNPRVVACRQGEFPEDFVRALRIVPLSSDSVKREMQVVCTVPIPGVAIRALARLMGWTVEPLLVSDETLSELIEAYVGPNRDEEPEAMDICDPESGSARIAQFAKRWRAVRLLHERCGPYVWIRLNSDEAKADVLMAAPELKGSY